MKQLIDWNILDQLSYRTTLEKSLKNTIRKFDRNALFDELTNYISFLIENADILEEEHRIKSYHSCELKYNKYYPSTEVEKVFNDILGIRITVSDYSEVKTIALPSMVKVVDLQSGKANDDGYRAIHYYYQKDHFYYPIEVQVMSSHDKTFNEWLHTDIYKYGYDNSVGLHLKSMYDNGIINSKEDFRKEMQNYVLSNSKKTH